jgi:hypothetical protein
MTKPTITRVFVGSLIALAGGLVLFLTAGLLAYANDAFVMDGPDVVGIETTAFGWTMIVLAVIGILVMIGGGIGQFVAWIGAVLNTASLQDKTWFWVLLLVGLFSFGLIAMIIYVLVGPDGTVPAAGRQPAMTRPMVPTA